MTSSQFKVEYSSAELTVTVHVVHELSSVSQRLLAGDLHRLAGFMGGRRGIATVRFELAVPLSRQFAQFVSGQCQLLELSGVVIRVPPLAPAGQPELSPELAALGNPSLRIEVRGA